MRRDLESSKNTTLDRSIECVLQTKSSKTCVFNPIIHANEFIWIEALNLTALLSTQGENAETERRDEAHG